MTWLMLGADVLLGCIGVYLLLVGYRAIGKPVGADEQYDVAMARQGATYKTVGWCAVGLAALGLLGGLLGIGF
jgi:hypothetical protein